MNPSTHVSLGAEKIGNITEPASAADQESLPWELSAFARALTVDIIRLSERNIEFDLIGVDASIANALRRILMSEIPTIAIEHVYVWINTSLVQDEVLAQRLGLVPIACDPNQLDFRLPGKDSAPNDTNTVVFKLSANCERVHGTSPHETDPDKLFTKPALYSGDISFVPQGNQSNRLHPTPAPVHRDILLAKLRPGQEVVCEMHCEKGIGKTHAKWSPVATASYRLLPAIEILQPIDPADCSAFAACFPPGVVEVRHKDGLATAHIVNPRLDTVSREVLRYPHFANKVRLGRKRDHFIFTVESAGQHAPFDLPLVAFKRLREKSRRCRELAEKLTHR